MDYTPWLIFVVFSVPPLRSKNQKGVATELSSGGVEEAAYTYAISCYSGERN